MNQINGSGSFFGLFVNNGVLFDKETGICNVDSNLVNLIGLKLVLVKAQS